MYRANPKRTGVYQTTGVRSLTGIKWELQIDSELVIAPSNVGFNCPLVIADGIIYLCHKRGYLYAVNSQSGSEIWKIKIDNVILDNLIFRSNIIYASSSNGSLYAVNVETQQIKWKSSINLIGNSNPVISENLLLVNSKDGNLYAIDLETGELEWKFKTTKGMVLTPPSLDNRVVYVGSKDGNIYAVNVDTGKEKWKCEVGELGLSSIPVIANDVVYIGIKNSIICAIEAESGTEIWQSQVEDTYYFSPLCPPAVDHRFVYIGVYIGSLCAINIKSQRKSWQKLDRNIQRMNSISVADGIIYCERSGAINAIEAESGNELWKFAAPEPKWWILKPNLWLPLIFNAFNNRVTGSSLIQFSSPIIDDGIIYTFCSNGYLYALH